MKKAKGKRQREEAKAAGGIGLQPQWSRKLGNRQPAEAKQREAVPLCAAHRLSVSRLASAKVRGWLCRWRCRLA